MWRALCCRNHAVPASAPIAVPEDVAEEPSQEVRQAWAEMWRRAQARIPAPEKVSAAEADVPVVQQAVDACLPRMAERDVYAAGSYKGDATMMIYIDVDPEFVKTCEAALQRLRESQGVEWNCTTTCVRKRAGPMILQ